MTTTAASPVFGAHILPSIYYALLSAALLATDAYKNFFEQAVRLSQLCDRLAGASPAAAVAIRDAHAEHE